MRITTVRKMPEAVAEGISRRAANSHTSEDAILVTLLADAVLGSSLFSRAAMVAALMAAGAAFAAPYEVAGPEAPKPHESTATNELSAYLAKRVAGTLRVGGKDGIVFRVGDTELARKNGLLSTQLPSEKWIVRSFGNEVLLNGGGSRGALFAANSAVFFLGVL